MSGGEIAWVAYLSCAVLCGVWMVNQWHRDPGETTLCHKSDYMIALCPVLIAWPILLVDLIAQELQLWHDAHPKPRHKTEDRA